MNIKIKIRFLPVIIMIFVMIPINAQKNKASPAQAKTDEGYKFESPFPEAKV